MINQLHNGHLATSFHIKINKVSDRYIHLYDKQGNHLDRLSCCDLESIFGSWDGVYGYLIKQNVSEELAEGIASELYDKDLMEALRKFFEKDVDK